MDPENQNEVSFKVAVKTRGVSAYLGRRRFPVTLYYEQWVSLLDAAGDLRQFLEEAKARGELALREK